MEESSSEPLHIGILVSSMAGGGAERTLLTLARLLIEQGHRIDILPLGFKGQYRNVIPNGARIYRRRRRHTDRELLRYCRDRGIEVQTLPVNPLSVHSARRYLRRTFPELVLRASEIRNLAAIASYVRKADPQILVSGSAGPNNLSVLAGAMAGRRVPVVVSLRTNVSVGVGYSGNGKSAAKLLMPRADAVVCISHGVEANAIKTLGLDPQRTCTIYNPQPLAVIRNLAEKEVSCPWFGANRPPVILTVLRDSPAKDPATLIAAFGQVRRRTEARLAILGHLPAPYRGQVMSMVEQAGVREDVCFLGFDENPFRYMRRANLFVFSSRFEGFSNVLVEALACGTPVVSTDAPYGPAEILENGRWGKLTPVGDVPALAQAITESLEGDTPPAEALQSRAGDFSAERSVAHYVELFRALVEQRGGGETAGG